MDSLVDNTSSICFSLLIGFQIYSKMNINIYFAIFSMESITQHMPIKLKTIPRYLQCLNLLLRIMSGFSNARMFWMGSNGANQNNPDGINTGNGHAWGRNGETSPMAMRIFRSP